MFRETAKQCFVSYFRIFSFQFCIFSSSFVPFIRMSYLLFEFRTFYSSGVNFFQFHRSFLTRSYPTPPPPTSPLHILYTPTHTSHRFTKQTHQTHSPHTLTTHTRYTHSPHTLITRTHHSQSPLALTTHTHHTHLPLSLTTYTHHSHLPLSLTTHPHPTHYQHT